MIQNSDAKWTYQCPAFEMSFRWLPRKNPDFGIAKMENIVFISRNRKQPSWRSSPSQEPRTCLIWDYLIFRIFYIFEFFRIFNFLNFFNFRILKFEIFFNWMFPIALKIPKFSFLKKKLTNTYTPTHTYVYAHLYTDMYTQMA
jgi:hypothetical protein